MKLRGSLGIVMYLALLAMVILPSARADIANIAESQTSSSDNLAKVYLDYTQAELDKNYTQTAWAPNAKQVLDRMSYRSELTRSLLGQPKIYRYTNNTINGTLDFFHSSKKKTPLLIYIHGGAWKTGKASDYNFIANPFITKNINVAILDFDDVTMVGLDGMLRQIQSAMQWLYLNANKLDIDKERIYIMGHSSGAHLAGVLLTSDWKALKLPSNIIKGATLISGMYDMEPVRLSVRSNYVKFDDRIEDRMSSIRHIKSINLPIILSHGSEESKEFKRQSEEFLKQLKSNNKSVKLIVQPFFNHFEIMDDIGNPNNVVTSTTIEMINSVKRD